MPTCNYCGEDPDDCAHRETWWSKSSDYSILIEENDRGIIGYNGVPAFKVAKNDDRNLHRGRCEHVYTRGEVVEIVTEWLEADGMTLEEAEVVDRTGLFNESVLKGTKSLARWSG